MRDNDLYFPYDNDPEPKKYTVLVETKVWSYVDIEAYNEEDLIEKVKHLSDKEIIETINEKEIEKAEIENGAELFDTNTEAILECKLRKFIKKFIEEGNKDNQTLEEAYFKMFEFYKSNGYEKYNK